MGTAFEFATAGRIIFGSGRRQSLGDELAALGRRVLVVTGAKDRHADWLEPLFAAATLEATNWTVRGEPTIELAEAGAALCRANRCDVVLGVGGGSCLDAAKAAAALATQPHDPRDYLEVIGAGRPLDAEPLPCVAVPTTAGTGAEVTRNAVLGCPIARVKVSLRHPAMLPRVAVVDPELTLSLPPTLTATTGLDALTQLIEPFVSPRANPLTDGFCREGLARIRWALPTVLENPRDLAAREAMSLASLLGGFALANAGLGAVHGFAGPLGGMLDAPHGGLCGILLPGVMEANVASLVRNGGPAPAIERFREAARILTGSPEAEPADALDWTRSLLATASLPRLTAYGMTEAAIPEAIEKAKRASSMRANPVELDDEQLAGILRDAF
jgi:alcohol dehydrogenase class IV